MSIFSQSQTGEILTDGLREAAGSSQTFDANLAVKIGQHMQARRILCGLSKQQLGTRLDINAADVNAYERGTKRISCKLLLATAKQLRATPRFFFQ